MGQLRRSAPGRFVHEHGFALAVCALLALAFVIRAGYVLNTWRFLPIEDAHGFDKIGRGLATGHGWVFGSGAYQPPGYPFFLAGVYSIIGVPVKTARVTFGQYGGWTDLRLVEAGVATVTVGLIGWLARQLAGRRVALVALALAAVYLPLTVVGVSMMDESLLVPLELAAVNFAVRSRAPGSGRGWIVLAGLFAGLCALTRANGIVIGVALAVVVWSATPRLSWRSLSAPVLLLAVMVLTISPWTIRNAIAQHAFIPVSTELGATLAGTYNNVAARHDYQWQQGAAYSQYRSIRKDRKLTGAVRSSRLTSAVLSYIAAHPQSVPEAFFWNTVRLLDLHGLRLSRQTAGHDVGASRATADWSVYSFWIVAALSILGALVAPTRRIPKSLWLVPLLIWFSEAPFTTGTPRFRAALEPWFVLLAGIAIATVARQLSAAGARGTTPAQARTARPAGEAT